jgi:hypothetical protein
LLFGLLHTLFDEGLTRTSHLPVDGLEELRAAVAPFSAESMSPRCGVSAEQIRQLARNFAAADRAVCYGRMGVSTQAFGTLCQWLVQSINLMTGNLDRVGGALCTEPAVDLVANTSGGHFDRWQSRVSGLPEYGGELPVSALAEEMLTEGDGQIRALITVAGNPVLSTPNGRQLEQALDGLEFMLSVDFYINETTRYADLILPPTAPLEHDHYDTTFNLFAVRNVTRFNEAVLAKPAGALHDWEIFVGLARAFAARTGGDLKPTIAPEQLIDLGLRAGPYGDKSELALSLAGLRDCPHGLDLGALKPNLAGRLKTANQRIQAAPELFLGDVQRFALAHSASGSVGIDRASPCAQQQLLDAQLSPPGEGQAAPSAADESCGPEPTRVARRSARAGSLAGRDDRSGSRRQRRNDARCGQSAAWLGSWAAGRTAGHRQPPAGRQRQRPHR